MSNISEIIEQKIVKVASIINDLRAIANGNRGIESHPRYIKALDSLNAMLCDLRDVDKIAADAENNPTKQAFYIQPKVNSAPKDGE